MTEDHLSSHTTPLVERAKAEADALQMAAERAGCMAAEARQHEGFEGRWGHALSEASTAMFKAINHVEAQASTITDLEARLAERHEDLCFLGKWIERGLFCKTVTAAEALSVLAHFPGMPWNSERWDVDHKPYAAAYYAKFPKTAAKDQPHAAE